MPVIGESFHALMARFYAGDSVEDCVVVEASLRSVLAGRGDPLGLVAYLRSTGLVVATLDDLMAINLAEDEEELSAWPVAEGIALTLSSQAAWVLFRP